MSILSGGVIHTVVITEQRLNAWLILILQGKFIVRNIALIRTFFEKAEKTTIPSVAIDLSGVTQIDSSAITILVNFQRRIIKKDGRLVLFGMRSDIAEIFSIVGIENMFRICSTRNDFEMLYAQQNV